MILTAENLLRNLLKILLDPKTYHRNKSVKYL